MSYDRELDRSLLLKAALPHIAFDGWSEAALEAGAKDCDMTIARRLNAFPGGAAELMDFFQQAADTDMIMALSGHDLGLLRVRERIALIIRTRLALNLRHIEAVRQGVSFLAMPQNLALGARCLYRTIDVIWRAAGDRATDYNFYTKRALLAGVYTATILYWLNDSSLDKSESGAFLERRIDEVMALPKSMRNISQALEWLPNPLRVIDQIRARGEWRSPRSRMR